MTDENTNTESTDTKPTTGTEETAGGDSTAEAIGDGAKSALAKEREARREAERRANEAESEANTLKAAELRRSVAEDRGLTAAQAKFLEGEDRESLEQRADELLEAFPAKGNATGRAPSGGIRSGATGETEGAKSMGAVAEDVMKNW